MKYTITGFLLFISLSVFSQSKPHNTASLPKVDTVNIFHLDLTEDEMVNLFYLVQTGNAHIFDTEIPAKEAKAAVMYGQVLAQKMSAQSAIWHPATSLPKTDSTNKKKP